MAAFCPVLAFFAEGVSPGIPPAAGLLLPPATGPIPIPMGPAPAPAPGTGGPWQGACWQLVQAQACCTHEPLHVGQPEACRLCHDRGVQAEVRLLLPLVAGLEPLAGFPEAKGTWPFTNPW